MARLELLTPWQKFCYMKFGPKTKAAVKKNYTLRFNLEKAHMTILPEAYIATVWMTSIVVACVGAGIVAMGVLLFYVLFPIPKMMGIMVLAGLGAPGICYSMMMKIPGMAASGRRRTIDVYIPYATNYIAAMSAANATPDKVFKSLASQKAIYKEVAEEAAWIYRDLSVLGMDLITTLKRSVDRTPSLKMQEFLQGMVGVLMSGGDLRAYFMGRADFFMRENRRTQVDFIESLAFLAESYVVVAVAMPMFLMIIMVITSWISGAGSGSFGTDILWLIVFLMLPALHMGYFVAVYTSTPEV